MLDEVIGVLLYQLAAVVPPTGQLEHLHLQLGAFQQGDGPLGGVHTGVVVVVAQHQLLGVLFQNADVLFRQSRAHGGNGVVKARLV